MATNQGFKSFIPDRSRLDEKYLFWWLVSNKAALQRLGVGATFKEISKAIVSRVVILLPPLPEQRRIASILDEAQTLRRLAESRVVLLEDMVRSAFRATQASASLARVRLSDIAEVVGGSTPKSGVAELWDGDIPWITPADLSKNADLVISKTARTISDQGLRSIGNRLLPPGAVLLSSRAPIGLVGIVGVPMATNQGFKSLIPDAEIVDSTYLYWWLRANRATLERRGVGATFKELSKTVVESIELALPPIEEQREFGRLARDAEEARLRAVASLRQVQLLTDSLQARAIRGEL
ncbi:type I restriction enzyme S subunit [Chryseoglobus frigidaquae]|uniref:Type I restriction enzyme S subunit n=2 Tax=Microcella frigidaquae TaxID=424758 RepID=A0A840X751_9MICO|nr:type I restriction enzyme S subunit [Microcella frigidaquae]